MRRLVPLFVCVGLVIPASADARTVALRVSQSPVTWVSPERFRASDGVAMRLHVDGREAIYEQASRCVVHWYARGAAVTTNTCGPRLRVRAVSTRRVRVVLRYWRE